MTQEEKARAYDEALEQAKKELATCGSMDCDAARQIFRFFPELRESEDERIRKLLVWQVYRNIEDETNDLAQSVYDGIKGHDPDIEESIEDWKRCLAWLEKQKEQKQAEWSEEDKEKIVTISEIIEHCTTIPYSGGTLTLNKEYKKELLCFIKSLRPQYHGDVTMTEAYKMGLEAGKASSWKPSEEQMKAFEDAMSYIPEFYKPKSNLASLLRDLKKL